MILRSLSGFAIVLLASIVPGRGLAAQAHGYRVTRRIPFTVLVLSP